jgi:hypothetical protein
MERIEEVLPAAFNQDIPAAPPAEWENCLSPRLLRNIDWLPLKALACPVESGPASSSAQHSYDACQPFIPTIFQLFDYS